MLKEDTIQCAEEKKPRNILLTALRNILPVTVSLPSTAMCRTSVQGVLWGAHCDEIPVSNTLENIEPVSDSDPFT